MFINARKAVENNFWTIIATLIFGILLYMADLGEVWSTVTSISPFLMFTIIFLGTLSNLIRAYVWHQYFSIADINSGVLKTTKLFFVGRFLDLTTPVGNFISKPITAYLISRETKAEIGKLFALILTAIWLMIFPLFFSIIIGYIGLFRAGNTPAEIHYFMAITSITSIVGLTVGMTGWFKPELFRKSMELFGNRLQAIISLFGKNSEERIDSLISDVDLAFEIIRKNPRTFKLSIFTTSVAFGVGLITFWLSAYGTGIHLTLSQLLFILPIAAVANLGPTPGGSGAIEASVSGLIIALTPSNLSIALTSVLIYRAATLGTGLLIGYIGFTRLKAPESEFRDSINIGKL